MKIKDIKTLPTVAGWRKFVKVRVTTDDGIVGYGERTLDDFERTIESAVNDLKPFLVGRELEITEITNFFVKNSFWRNGPIMSTAQSVIEQALWDAAAKSVNNLGLGIEINEEALTKYPYKKIHLEYFSEEYTYHGDVEK